MPTGLSTTAERTVLHLAHAFDGAAFTRALGQPNAGASHAWASQQLAMVQQTGRLLLRTEENVALNAGLHRFFHHWGSLPEARSAHWYTMLFLYLHLYRCPVPPAYRHAELYVHWAHRPKGAAEAAAADIRQLLHR